MSCPAVQSAELDEILKPIDSALRDCPSVQLDDDLAYYARLGQAVLVPGTPSSGVVRLYNDKRMFMGIGNILDDGRVAPKPAGHVLESSQVSRRVKNSGVKYVAIHR